MYISTITVKLVTLANVNKYNDLQYIYHHTDTNMFQLVVQINTLGGNTRT